MATKETYKQFRLVKKVPVGELLIDYQLWRHEPTGASVIYLGTDDTENAFTLSFQTVPKTSNGVAHILEHVILCGSKKYPVRDPFFSMNRRSLNTFMNAMTGSDHTYYPAATQVKKDFYNLLSVYLDAVFNPLLTEMSFLQEGHRLEFENPYDPSTPLKIKGIVYNEMKGAMSCPESRLYDRVCESLYPNTTYGVVSGGDPKEIPNLTYKEMKKFHQTHYQPSDCLFYFYGDIPVEEHLDFLQKEVLSKVKKKASAKANLTQKKIKGPVFQTSEYPAPLEEKDKDLFGVGFLTLDTLKVEEALVLQLLDLLLMGTDAAPLKSKILKSNLCNDADSIYDLDNRQAPYLLLFRNCKDKRSDKLYDLIFKTLEEVKKKGFTKKQIDGAFHQLEFEKLEITGGGYPFGLELFSRIAALKHHGGNPLEGLQFKTLIESVKIKAKSKAFFNRYIDRFFLKNKHHTAHLMRPSATLASKEHEDETALLKQVKRQLTQDQTKQLITQSRALKKLQEKDESKEIEVLPKIKVSDVPKDGVDYRLDRHVFGNTELFHHPAFTNHICYADLIFEIPHITKKELPYLQLLASILPELGAGKRSYKQNLEWIQENTGGLDAAVKLNLPISGPRAYKPFFKLKCKALDRNIPKMFSLLHQTATAPKLNDPARIKDLLFQQYVFLENHIYTNPLKYALNLSSSSFSLYHSMKNHLFGIEYYHAVKSWLKNFDKDKDKIIAILDKLCKKIFSGGKIDLVTTCSPKMGELIVSKNLFDLENLPTKKKAAWGKTPIDKNRKRKLVGMSISSPVAFTSEAFAAPLYTDKHAPAISVAANLMDNTVLHKRIREQGGAYGSGALADVQGGLFYLYAYRDPHLLRTKAAFAESVQTLAKGDFTKEHLEEAKLEWFQGADKPLPPGSRGLKAYVYYMEGKSFEIRQAFRNKVRKVKKEEIIQSVKSCLEPKMKASSTFAFADRTFLQTENSQMKEAGLSKFVIEDV